MNKKDSIENKISLANEVKKCVMSIMKMININSFMPNYNEHDYNDEHSMRLLWEIDNGIEEDK